MTAFLPAPVAGSHQPGPQLLLIPARDVRRGDIIRGLLDPEQPEQRTVADACYYASADVYKFFDADMKVITSRHPQGLVAVIRGAITLEADPTPAHGIARPDLKLVEADR